MSLISVADPRRTRIIPKGGRVGVVAGLIWVGLLVVGGAMPMAAGGEKGRKEYGPWVTSSSEIGDLIQQLGSGEFSERVKAGKALEAVGEPALEPLRKAARDSEDAEIRRRAKELIPLVESGMKAYGAWVTSAHAVYTMGEPIDLTIWVRKSAGPITPGLEVRDSSGQKVAEKRGGRPSAGSKDHPGSTGDTPERIPPAVQGGRGRLPERHIEQVPDLRERYEIDQPGVYYVRFTGKEALPEGKSQEVLSNTMKFILREKPDSSGRVVPLKEIWALEMPGTRAMDITFSLGKNEEDRRFNSPEGQLVLEICGALSYDPFLKHPVAEEGFAVPGKGMDALREAHSILVKGKQTRRVFRKGEEISLVVYSYSGGCYTHLVGVEQRGQVVQVMYRFVYHQDKGTTDHIAIIPLGKVEGDTIEVEMKPQIDPRVIERFDWSNWIPLSICRSFTLKLNEMGNK